jgi:hypothetical protein
MNDMPDLPTCVLNRTPYIGVILGTEESQGDVLATFAPTVHLVTLYFIQQYTS